MIAQGNCWYKIPCMTTDSASAKSSSAFQKSPQDALRLSGVTPEVYGELRKVAHRYMAREIKGRTLQATALVNEAWLKLANEKSMTWKNCAHFRAVAAHIMRELLVERARARAAQKRGGSRVRISLNAVDIAVPNSNEADDVDILALHEALERFSAFDPELARLVELRFFGGLSIEETAATLACSPATVKRGWTTARAWLRHELAAENES